LLSLKVSNEIVLSAPGIASYDLELML